MMAGIPKPWLDELNDQFALVGDPDGRAAVLDEMAYAAYRRREVSADDLVDMLELSEAARAWGLLDFDVAEPSHMMVDRGQGGVFSES